MTVLKRDDVRRRRRSNDIDPQSGAWKEEDDAAFEMENYKGGNNRLSLIFYRHLKAGGGGRGRAGAVEGRRTKIRGRRWW